MAELSIGAAVGSGFELIRRRPLSVLAWGLIRVAFIAGVLALMAPFYAALFAQVASAARSGVPATPDLSGMMQMQGLSYLISFAGYFITTVLYCAVLRAVLHPDRRRFAYLRIGSAELFLFVIVIGASIALMVSLLVLCIPIAIVIALLAATHAAAGAIIVGVLAGVALCIGLIYVALRFSLVAPMVVDDGKFHLFESWTLTKGRTGSLFLLALCLVAIIVAAEVVLGAVFLTLGVGMLGAAAGGVQNLAAFFEQPPRVFLPKLAPLLAIVAILWIPIVVCFMAIMGAPWARVYRDLAVPEASAAVS